MRLKLVLAAACLLWATGALAQAATPIGTRQPVTSCIDAAAGTVCYVSGTSINARSCSRTSCTRSATLRYGTPVTVRATVSGEAVGGNTRWIQARLESGETVYIHSSLLTNRQPATPRPGAQPGPVSTPVPNAPVSTPAPARFTCNCSKTCGSMTCEEAYFQLNQCGCSARDADSDGVPCESICPGG